MDPLLVIGNDNEYIGKHNSNYSALRAAVTAVENGKQDKSAKGMPDGYAALNSTGVVPLGQLPGVEQLANKGEPEGYVPLNAVGEIDDIYFPASITGGTGGGTTSSAIYDVPVFFSGVPGNAALLTRVKIPRTVVFPINLTGSYADATVAATATTTLTIYRNASNIGTITFAAAATTGTFAFSSAQTFAAGDVLVIQNQGTADATLANISITLAGTR